MSLNHLFHVMNASLSFVVISITGSQFRKTLFQVLSCTKEEGNGRMRSRAPTNQSLATNAGLENSPASKRNVKETFELRKVTFNATYVKHTEETSIQST